MDRVCRGRYVAAALMAAQVLIGCGSSDPSVQVVASALGNNKLGVSPSDLRTKTNPKGKGTFVYVEETRLSGVERKLIWLVLDGKGFPLNGATKDVTPSLPWPREADQELWQATGLDPFMPTEAVQIIFGS